MKEGNTQNIERKKQERKKETSKERKIEERGRKHGRKGRDDRQSNKRDDKDSDFRRRTRRKKPTTGEFDGMNNRTSQPWMKQRVKISREDIERILRQRNSAKALVINRFKWHGREDQLPINHIRTDRMLVGFHSSEKKSDRNVPPRCRWTEWCPKSCQNYGVPRLCSFR